MARAKPIVEETAEPMAPKAKAKGEHVELCMTLSHALDVRLTLQARLQRIGKSQFTEKLLDQALSRYGTDKTLKAMLDGSEGETEVAA